MLDAVVCALPPYSTIQLSSTWLFTKASKTAH